jgi:hypothetical protein
MQSAHIIVVAISTASSQKFIESFHLRVTQICIPSYYWSTQTIKLCLSRAFQIPVKDSGCWCGGGSSAIPKTSRIFPVVSIQHFVDNNRTISTVRLFQNQHGAVAAERNIFRYPKRLRDVSRHGNTHCCRKSVAFVHIVCTKQESGSNEINVGALDFVCKGGIACLHHRVKPNGLCFTGSSVVGCRLQRLLRE